MKSERMKKMRETVKLPKTKGIRALTRVEKRRSDESLLVDKSHKHELVRTHNKIAQEKEIKQEKR